LGKYGIDLVEQTRKGKMDPVIGRDDEIRWVIRILSRKTKKNLVLIGEPGVGKAAIVEGLAQPIARGDVPEGLKDKTLFAPIDNVWARFRSSPSLLGKGGVFDPFRKSADAGVGPFRTCRSLRVLRGVFAAQCGFSAADFAG
jgi:hypothetical protein